MTGVFVGEKEREFVKESEVILILAAHFILHPLAAPVAVVVQSTRPSSFFRFFKSIFSFSYSGCSRQQHHITLSIDCTLHSRHLQHTHKMTECKKGKHLINSLDQAAAENLLGYVSRSLHVP